MKVLRIDHLGIAVPALGPAVSAYEALGFTVDATHDVPTEKVRTAFLPVGESQLELLEPTDPTSVIARFLEKRAGLHHVCVVVDDIVAALAELKARGVTVIMVTHSATFMAALDKLALLKNGTLELFGPSATVLARLRSPPATTQRVVAFPPSKGSEVPA